ncbi:MAG: AraC family transcriptional regulator [Solirubrobacterales bacterium]
MNHSDARIRFVRSDSLPDVEFVAGNNVDNRFPVHLHRKYCIGTLVRGQGLLTCGSVEYRLRNGDVYLINPGDVHTLHPLGEKPISYAVLSIGEDFFARFFGEDRSEAVPRFTVNTLTDSALSLKIRNFGSILALKEARLQAESAFMMIFTGLAPCLALAPAETEPATLPISRFLAWLDTRLCENLTLGDLAGQACLSKFHFARLFKEETGLSPYEYLLQERIKRAKVLLESGHSPGETAQMIGFSDQSHFTRCFKKHVGVTPARYQVIRTDE